MASRTPSVATPRGATPSASSDWPQSATREGNLPYPQRALGSPKFSSPGDAPSAEAVEKQTYAAFANMDASPTKAWLFTQRDTPEWKWHYQYAFGKRPGEELYDLRRDPHQTNNLAADPVLSARRTEMSAQLLQILRDTRDPRVTGDGQTFERPPFTDPNPMPRR